MKNILSLIFIFIFFTACGQNQSTVPEKKIRNHRSGLTESQLKDVAASNIPMSMTRNVRQAKNGDILIASYVGVYQYDGTSFGNMTKTIDWPTFWDVLEDRKGNLWLASQDSGVYFKPYGQTDFKLFRAKDGTGISSALHIYEDRAGNIWFGASRYDGKSIRTFTTEDGFPSNNLRLLLEDKNGKLWFGGHREHLLVYDTRRHGDVGKGKPFDLLRNNEGKPFTNVWSVTEDSKGNIWFGDDAGLWRYDGTNYFKVSNRGAYAIIEDKSGNIWTTGGGIGQNWALSRYDAGTLYNENPTVTEIMAQSTALLGLVEATDGSIWFGSMLGVHRYNGNTTTDFKSVVGEN